MLYKSRQAVITLLNKYSLIGSEAKHKVKYAEGLQLLSPKRMLQRLLIVLAQVKAGNTSENLLNEIRQTIYSLYREKGIESMQQYNEFNKVMKQCILYLWILRIVNIWSSQTITKSFG